LAWSRACGRARPGTCLENPGRNSDITSHERYRYPRPARVRLVPAIAKGAALNEHGYHVWQVERNLYAVTDNVYMSAFLTTPGGVVIFDAPPNIGHNIRRAVDEITAANGLTNQVTHMVYSHHHSDHQGASSLFGGDIVRIGHEETRRLLLRDDDPARPVPDVTFSDS
jgi:glyoxylase-like metal-dependent hydrolase (beta-lactamase superfamily II)